MSTSAIQLTINHPGTATPFAFTGVSFLTTPVTGRYVRANDTDTGDGNTLTIEFSDATPPDGSAYEDELNGAVINWILPPPPPPITFAGDSSGGASSGVFSANGDGTGRVRLFDATFTGSDYFHPRWAPDRSRIAFGLEAAGAPIHMLEVVSDDGAETAAVVSDKSIRYPRWSPDGQHLAFACGPDSYTPYTQFHICVINDATGSVSSLAGRGNGGGSVQISAFDLVNRAEGVPAFAWNPANAAEIAFVRDSAAGTSSRIYRAVFDGSVWNVTPLSSEVMDLGDGSLVVESNWLDWSPDGQTLTFAASDPTSGIGHIYTIGNDGNGLTQLTSGSDWDDSPLWSPTGTEILFSRDQSCSLDAWIMASDGSAQRQASAESVCDYNTERLGYDWSPDGQEIVITGFDQPYGNLLIFKILRTTTSGTYFTDRLLIGRGASVPGSGEVVDIQPSWRP
jgi:dipeptidyl aminopeptidase/acylaminoacyl peptidase